MIGRESEVGAAYFEAGTLPRVATHWEPVASWTEPAHVRGVLLPCPAALMRPFYIVFKLMFSILTLLWIFGFRGPHKGVLSRKPQAPIKGIFSSASKQALRSQSHRFCCFFFFGQYYLGRRHARTCLRAIIVRKITFLVGTQLHRSKQKHVLTSLSFFLCFIYLTLHCVFKYFSFSFFLRKEKACHRLTDYVITVKFMLFCNLETSYSMAHLIKHLK